MPWLEGYTLPRRRANTRQQQEVLYEDPEELVLPHFSTAEPPMVSASDGISKCRFSGSAGGSDDARPKKRKRTGTRTRTGTGVDFVKINRLNVCTLILT